MFIDLSKLVKSYTDEEISKVIDDYPRYKDLLKEIPRKILEYEIPIYFLTTYGDFNKAVMEIVRHL